MNTKSLVKIINKELTILTDIVNEFSNEGDVHPFEIDMALSKIKDIYSQLLLLKDIESSLPGQFQTHLDMPQGTKVSHKDEIQVKNNVSPNTFEPQFESAKGAIPMEPIQQELVIADSVKVDLPTSAMEPELKVPSEFESEPSNEISKRTTNESPLSRKVVDELPIQKTNEKVEDILVQSIDKPAKKVDIPDGSEPKSNAKGTIIADKFQNLSPSLNDMLSGIHKNKDLASSMKDRPIRNLKSAIKLNDRIWFTNELFNKNKVLFEKSVDAINQSSNLDEALAYLFSNFNWDQNQNSTISFLELVFRRFAN